MDMKEKIKNFVPRHVGIQLLILLIGQLLSYYGSKKIIENSPHMYIGMPLDNLIPLIPWTIIIYYGCFLFWAYNYAVILRNEPEGTYRFFSAELLGKLICFLFYVMLPTIMVRPEVTGTDIFSRIISMMYSIDAPDALFPSMHCFVSWMCVIGLRGKPEITRRHRILSVIAAFLVFIATLTTKQHVIIDVISGVALAELVYFVTGLFCKKAPTPQHT